MVSIRCVINLLQSPNTLEEWFLYIRMDRCVINLLQSPNTLEWFLLDV